LYQGRGESFGATWTLFSSFNIGTVLIQGAIAIAILFLLNGWLVAKLSRGKAHVPIGGAENHEGPDLP